MILETTGLFVPHNVWFICLHNGRTRSEGDFSVSTMPCAAMVKEQKKKHLPVHSVFYSITCTNKTPANFKKVKGDANSTGILPLKCPAGSRCLWQSFGNHFYGTDSKAISKHTSMKINLHLFLKTYKSLFNDALWFATRHILILSSDGSHQNLTDADFIHVLKWV